MLPTGRVQILPALALSCVRLSANHNSALRPLENGWQLFKRIRKMLDDLKSTDNVVRSAVILKVFGQNGWLRGSQIAGRQNRDLSRGGKGDHCRRRNPKSSPCGEAQRTRQFEYRTLIAQARSQPAGRQSSDVGEAGHVGHGAHA